jgi:hypothetical protein
MRKRIGLAAAVLGMTGVVGLFCWSSVGCAECETEPRTGVPRELG